MVMIDHDHVEQEQEVLEVKPTVVGDVEGDVHIDGIVVVLVQVQVQVQCVHDHDHDHNYEQAEEKEELPVAEPDEQVDFDTEEGGEQVQVQVQRIQRVGQSVGALGCLESVGHVLSVERPPEPHAMQRYLEGSGP